MLRQLPIFFYYVNLICKISSLSTLFNSLYSIHFMQSIMSTMTLNLNVHTHPMFQQCESNSHVTLNNVTYVRTQ